MKKVLRVLFYVSLSLSVLFIFCILPFTDERVYHSEGRVSAIEYRDDGSILLEITHLTRPDAEPSLIVVPKNVKIRYEKDKNNIELQDVIYFNTYSKKNKDGYAAIKEMLVMFGDSRPYKNEKLKKYIPLYLL